MTARPDDPGPSRELVNRLNAMLAAVSGREPRGRSFSAPAAMFVWTVERYAAEAGREHARRQVSGAYAPSGPGSRSGRARAPRSP